MKDDVQAYLLKHYPDSCIVCLGPRLWYGYDEGVWRQIDRRQVPGWLNRNTQTIRGQHDGH